jgi:hypothetical protein
MAVTSKEIISNILGLIGAVGGGVLGYYIFLWLINQGFYGLMIPGALLGLGCSLLSQHRSQTRGLLCGVAGLVLGMYSEWCYKTFLPPNDGFVYMVTHIHEKQPVTLLMLALGAVFAYWLGKDAGFQRLSGNRGLAVSRQNPDRSPSN